MFPTCALLLVQLVVQVGDILDRGEDEIAILSLLRHLDRQAREAGGRVFQVSPGVLWRPRALAAQPATGTMREGMGVRAGDCEGKRESVCVGVCLERCNRSRSALGMFWITSLLHPFLFFFYSMAVTYSFTPVLQGILHCPSLPLSRPLSWGSR